jgi:competence protein ComEC
MDWGIDKRPNFLKLSSLKLGVGFIFRDPFVLWSVSFLAAVFISSFADFNYPVILFVALLGVVIFLYSIFFIPVDSRKVFILVSVSFIVLSLGLTRFELKDNHKDGILLSSVGGPTSLQGVIVEEPIYKNSYRQYVIKTADDDKILVRGSVYPEYKYGDKIIFEGKLEKPEPFENARGEVFDYPAYLAMDDIYFVMSFASGEFVTSGEGNFIKEKLVALKGAFITAIEENIREPASSLLGGILLGIEDSMGKDLEDAFRTTGVIHIIVLSGYNITLVVDAIYWVLSRIRALSQRTIFIAEVLGILLFVLMVGGSPSVVRAALMATLVLLARTTGRTYMVARALLITAVAMVIWNPKTLVFDTGFELSFLATIAIIWIAPFVKAKLGWITEKLGLRAIIADTLSTQVFVLPLLLHKMGLLSVVSLFSNILVLPVIPVSMFFGFFTGLLGMFSSILAFPFAIISQILLSYIIKIIEILAEVPYAAVSISYFPAYLMWIVYFVYGFLILKIVKNKKQKSSRS